MVLQKVGDIMGASDFIAIPIYGPGDETVKVNRKNIADVRVILTVKNNQEEWWVQVLMLAGKYYLLRSGGAPYESKALALAARDEFLSTLNS